MTKINLQSHEEWSGGGERGKRGEEREGRGGRRKREEGGKREEGEGKRGREKGREKEETGKRGKGEERGGRRVGDERGEGRQREEREVVIERRVSERNGGRVRWGRRRGRGKKLDIFLVTYFSSTIVSFPFISSTIIFSSSAIRICGLSSSTVTWHHNLLLNTNRYYSMNSIGSFILVCQ